MPTRLISAASQPAATAPRMSQVWQATRQSREGSTPEFLLDVAVGLARRLVVLHAVRTEPPLERTDDAAVLELTRLNLEQIVREGDEPESRGAQTSQGFRNLGVGRHRGELLRQLFPVLVVDLDAARISQHRHHSRSDVGERDIAPGHGQGRGVKDQVVEPQAHRTLLAKDALEGRFHGFKIEKGFVDVEDDKGERGHGGLLRRVDDRGPCR